MNQDPFKEYIRQTEPDKRDKGYAWHTAIGLQDVDGLTPSKYLIDTAIQNIEGKITLDEAQKLLDSYYAENPSTDLDDRTEEADKVSVRIARILSEKAFSFTPNEYISIHKRLFTGIYPHAGKIRDYNITKKEWVLDGETVLYGSAAELRETLNYDLKNGIYETTEFLELFLRNLLLGEENELRNRALHLRRVFQNSKKPDIGTKKPNIDSERLYIDDAKTVYTGSRRGFTKKTVSHIKKMYAAFGLKSIFGRSDAEAVLGLKATSTSELLKKLLEAKIIKPVSGCGKGKYRFSEIEVLEVLCGKQ